MKVNAVVSGDVRLTHNGASVRSHSEKIIAFYMEPVVEHRDTVWKIDGFSGRFPAHAQKIIPED